MVPGIGNDQLIADTGPVCVIGAAPVEASLAARARALAPLLLAADGGADRALALGWRPDAVTGDMDSISPAAQAELADILHPVAEQETTDFEKALTRTAAPLVLALGVTGGRIDHDLAALHLLVARPERRCLLLGAASLVFVCPPQIALEAPLGAPLSLFPLAPCRCASTGLRWPTDHLLFAPGGRIGTSNAVTGPVQLQADMPAMLVIMPQAALESVVPALLAAPGWPAARGQ